MKKHISLLCSSFILLGVFTSCDSGKKTTTNEKDTTNSLSKKVVVDTTSFEFDKGKVTQVQSRSVPGRIQAEILREYLPKSLPNATTYPPSMTVTTENGQQVVTVSKEYTFSGNGSAMISIVDFGASQNNEPPSTFKEFCNSTAELNVGVTREKFTFAGHSGCMVSDETKRNGIAQGLIANRFLVKVEGSNIPASIATVGAILQFIKSEELVALSSSVQ